LLYPIAEVASKIASGKTLLLAGSESALSQLPKGNWIGGTTSYFIDAKGGTCSESSVFVNEVPDFALGFKIVEYTPETLPSICTDAPEKGFSFLILPAGSPVHTAYAQGAPGYEGLILKPVVGWVCGVPLTEIGRMQPKVFNGLTGESSSSRAVVMHIALPKNKVADLEIVNVFTHGTGDAISFPESGFAVSQCLVNGKSANFAQYIASVQADVRLPLTGNYNGSVVNVSLQSVDKTAGIVRLYAPVFPGVEYRFAAPVADYVTAFEAAIHPNDAPAVFSCNCILNYVHANLEGKSTGCIMGPITFGEIAHQLLNQTLVRLLIYDCA
jgi:hypothetical protein